MRDDLSIMVEYRNLTFGIDRDEPRLVLLEAMQIDVDALEFEVFFLEADECLQGIRDRFGVVQLQHYRRVSSMSARNGSGSLAALLRDTADQALQFSYTN
jgi:hypothetical protein